MQIQRSFCQPPLPNVFKIPFNNDASKTCSFQSSQKARLVKEHKFYKSTLYENLITNTETITETCASPTSPDSKRQKISRSTANHLVITA